MPTLRDLQHAMRRGLIARDTDLIATSLSDGVGSDRLDIYRNTVMHGLTRALRLSFPAVERLVGPDFFAAAAEAFIALHLPHAAWLDRYGDRFPDFLRDFPPAQSLPYLGDTARLEWAVSCALPASDHKPLELADLTAINPEDQGRVTFFPHPSVSLLRTNYPVDALWRAVLAGDDDALASLDLASGPLNLLVERTAAGVDVSRLEEPAWRFLSALCTGEALHSAIDRAGALDIPSALAAHLAAGRFVAFALSPHEAICAQDSGA